jgi:RimJ/RimL family protein N-acetyltransferase
MLNVKGARCCVRLATLRDSAQLLSANGNSHYWREAGFPSRAAYKKLVSLAIQNQVKVNSYQKSWIWTLDLYKKINLGMVYFVETYPRTGDGLGGIFSPIYRKRIAAIEAICISMHIIFSFLDYERISITVRPDNLEAMKMWTGLGFLVEGIRDTPGLPKGIPPVELAMGLTRVVYYKNEFVKRSLRELKTG